MQRQTLPELARTAVDDLIELVVAQIKLVRVEIASDLSDTLGRAWGFAAFGLLLLIGYTFVMVALALGLTQVWGSPWGWLTVGVAHIVAGAVGLLVTVRRLRGLEPLDSAKRELSESVHRVGAALSSSPEAAQR